ncbi:MAG TPA: SDR family NAD(P)-dependent oxidoreductase [Gemmatimonadales bacterium]|jgi:NAD(P)-dependent dehydrogenase (short-subunit alcohol dehydrogenase family)
MTRVAVVTGASGGIGQEIARGIAAAGYRVILACRDQERGEAARRAVAPAGGPGAELLLLDLSSQASIQSAAAELALRHSAVDVLVNNAAVAPPTRAVSADGIELTWATNVLGYFSFTALVLPALARAPAARIVNVASQMAYGLDLDDVEFRRRRYSASDAYAQSKQADRMLTWALARRLEGTSVTANALHPGSVDTRLLHAMAPGAQGITPREGADTAVWLATSADVQGKNGRYWIRRRETDCEFRAGPLDALWARCDEMTRR